MEGGFLQALVELLDNGIAWLDSAFTPAMDWISQAFFLPGNHCLAWLIANSPGLSDSLGVHSADDNRMLAALISSVAWLLAVVLIRALFNAVRDACLSIASLCRRFAETVSYRFRMFLRAGLAPVRGIERALQGRQRRLLEEFEIDELQLAVMRAQARRPLGHAITAVEAAEELRVRPLQAQQALTSLTRLHLMQVSFATSDECPGYLLTRPGQVYIASCNRSARLDPPLKRAATLGHKL